MPASGLLLWSAGVSPASGGFMSSVIYGRSGLRWLMLVGWMIIIFALSAQPNSSQATEHVFGSLNLIARKLAHMAEYAVLFLLACSAFSQTRLSKSGGAGTAGSGAGSTIRVRTTALVFSILYAASDELHQLYVHGRTPSAGDVLIDTAGMLLAWLILHLVQSKRA